jgi:hypothetical protein
MKSPVGTQTPPTGEAAVEMTLSQAKRVAKATVYVEGMYRNDVGPQRPPRGGGGSGLLFAKTTASISSGGSGSVTVYLADGVTLSSETLTAYLFLSGTVASGTKVYISFIKGKWHIVSSDC